MGTTSILILCVTDTCSFQCCGEGLWKASLERPKDTLPQAFGRVPGKVPKPLEGFLADGTSWLTLRGDAFLPRKLGVPGLAPAPMHPNVVCVALAPAQDSFLKRGKQQQTQEAAPNVLFSGPQMRPEQFERPTF